jgi:acetylglutamate kinase
MGDLILVKVGGAELQEGPELATLVEVLARLARQRPLVVVHGGGPEIAALQERLGLQPRFVEGLRVTDEASLWVAEMVLSGAVNKRLVARLVAQGVRAMGLSGVDAGLLRAKTLVHPQGDLGRVGEITAVDAACLQQLLSLGLTPVISPISLGEDGRALNVNADHAALAIAGALKVAEAVFLTNVPGVLRGGALMDALRAEEAEHLIATGEISGGMIPKVRSALEAIAAGVGAVRITDLAGFARGSGTRVLA